MLFSDVTSQFLKSLKGKSNETIKTYHHVIKQLSAFLIERKKSIQSVTREDIQQYLNNLAASDKSQATIQKHWSAINTFAKMSGKEKILKEIVVPSKEAAAKTMRSGLGKLEQSRLVKSVKKHGSRRDVAIIMLLLTTGILISELIALNKKDVTITPRKAKITAGKQRAKRTITLNAAARKALVVYLDQQQEKEKENEALFSSSRSGRLDVRSVQLMLKKHGVTARELRQTFIMSLVSAGKKLSEVQSLTGIQSPQQLSEYFMKKKEEK
ncbi:tyrosine-type recombinase/integrase [Fictibacillus aquaticus]|uniref:Core-binding (CB) domain-containing protein n=1 Tax=Fictibacillus aquaticus TaxID=2021314 RepID=A0A235F7L1_9BACL|nr:tyrosine-type recombinase/integrase [Fictibacillus aquaticus]OYD57296.1 hypothetical protein CGZ90_11450 [Fictibacillus aquaticus]